MAKHLVLNASGEGWRLPADTDLGDLEEQLSSAMLDASVLRVVVEAQDNPLVQGTLLLNGRVLGAAALMELPDPS